MGILGQELISKEEESDSLVALQSREVMGLSPHTEATLGFTCI